MRPPTARNVQLETGDIVSEIDLGGGATFGINWSQAIRSAVDRWFGPKESALVPASPKKRHLQVVK